MRGTEADRLSALLQAVIASDDIERTLAETEPTLLAQARGAIAAHLILSAQSQLHQSESRNASSLT